MNTKLTLSIDPDVIETAKEYAKSQRRSLSNIVEEYLKSLSKKKLRKRKSQKEEIDPLVKSLWGSVKIPEGTDYDELLTDALIEKHVK